MDQYNYIVVLPRAVTYVSCQIPGPAPFSWKSNTFLLKSVTHHYIFASAKQMQKTTTDRVAHFDSLKNYIL